MRTLKFRGKSQDGWHYFGLWETKNLPAIIPDTVGQFTGLVDRLGKEIYDFDLLQNIQTMKIWKVQWIDGGFEVPYCPEKYYEVIGNIYENPELLKNE